MNLKLLMNFDATITCTDKDGIENKFLYNLQKSDFEEKWTFKIIPSEIEVDDWFEFSIQKTIDNKGKVIQMKHQNMQEYVAKGIPDKMIEESSKVLNLEIISSTNIESAKSFGTEWRTGEATKVWKRLMALGKAKHDSETDIYTFQPL